MAGVTGRDPWAGFTHDPRDPAHAGLRAADRDRDLILAILGQAYAEGRLDRDEFDERSDAVSTARCLGDLPGLVSDVVAPTAPPVTSARADLARAAPEQLRARAEETVRAGLRSRAGGALGTAVICWVIWAVTGFGFVWPAIVTAAVLVGLVRSFSSREEDVLAELQRLEKKQRRALKPPDRAMGDD